jgi:glutamate racemase
MAYGELKHDFPHIPIFNVIDPAVNWVRDKHFAQVGVIATRATIRSRVYARRLQLQQPEMKIISKATPLLAPLVEEGFTQTEVSKGAIERYLGDPIFKELDALILACTHYPLLQGEIESYLNHQVEVLNSGRLVAETLAAELFRQNLNATEAHQPEAHFYVSEKTKAFSNVAKRFFGKSLILKEQFLPG